MMLSRNVLPQPVCLLVLATLLIGIPASSGENFVSNANFYDLPSANEITCIGHLTEGWKKNDRNLGLPYPYHGLPLYLAEFFQHPAGLYRRDGAATTLAKFCAHSMGVTCIQDVDLQPQHLQFPLLLQLEAEMGNGEVKSFPIPEDAGPFPLDPNYIRMVDYRSVQMAAEYCRTKCACTNAGQTTDRAAMSNYYAPTRSTSSKTDEVLVWNFDSHEARSRKRKPSEMAWWKNGFVETRYSVSYEFKVNQILAQYYVGAPENKVVCDTRTFSNVLETILYSYTNETYTTATELCAHRYYGGNNYTTMGGICLQKFGGAAKRHLVFPYELKSTVFTREYPRPPTLQDLAFPVAIEHFCQRHCSCDHIWEDERAADEEGTIIEAGNLAVASEQMCASTSEQGDSCASAEETTLETGASAQSGAETNQCPAQCTYASRSTKPSCGDGCECRAFESIDPVFPATLGSAKFSSWCISSVVAMAAAAIKINGVSAGKGRMVPRSYLDVPACPCNLTYVSTACCGTGISGLVWEDANFKLGEIQQA